MDITIGYAIPIIVILGGFTIYHTRKWLRQLKWVTITECESKYNMEEAVALNIRVMTDYYPKIRSIINSPEYLKTEAYKTKDGKPAVYLDIPKKGERWFECNFYISGRFSITYDNEVFEFESFSEIRDILMKAGVLEEIPELET